MHASYPNRHVAFATSARALCQGNGENRQDAKDARDAKRSLWVIGRIWIELQSVESLTSN
jgi:hypothetical protein